MAKINLGLRVLWKQANGYHFLNSVFVPIDLADKMHLTFTPNNHKKDSHSFPILTFQTQLPSYYQKKIAAAFAGDGSQNIIHKAISLYKNQYEKIIGKTPNLPSKIHVEKKIPSPAGLGGGSSNAGSLVRALLETEPKEIYDALAPVLFDAMLELGADIPFFLDPRPALILDKGVPFFHFHFPQKEGILGIPPIGFSTRIMFKSLKKNLHCVKKEKSALTKAFSEVAGYLKSLDGSLCIEYCKNNRYERFYNIWENAYKKASASGMPANDFFLAAKETYLQEYERLLAYKKAVTDFTGATARLTGSGASFFALGDSMPKGVIEDLKRLFPEVTWLSFSSAMGRSQVVRQRVLIPPCGGSNPPGPE